MEFPKYHGIPTWEKRLPREHLYDNAAHTPHVDRLAIHLTSEEYFGTPIPPGGYLLRQDDLLLLFARRHEAPHEPKIADLNLIMDDLYLNTTNL